MAPNPKLPVVSDAVVMWVEARWQETPFITEVYTNISNANPEVANVMAQRLSGFSGDQYRHRLCIFVLFYFALVQQSADQKGLEALTAFRALLPKLHTEHTRHLEQEVAYGKEHYMEALTQKLAEDQPALLALVRNLRSKSTYLTDEDLDVEESCAVIYHYLSEAAHVT